MFPGRSLDLFSDVLRMQVRTLVYSGFRSHVPKKNAIWVSLAGLAGLAVHNPH